MPPPETDPIRVLLADDHRVVLWGLERLLQAAGQGMTVVGTCSDPSKVVAAARDASPHVVVLDLDFGSERGIDLVRPIIDASGARVLVLTGIGDREAHCDAVMAGASGVVLKTLPAEIFLRAIGAVCAGEIWLDRAALGRLFARVSRPNPGLLPDPCAALTDRERQIVLAIAAHATLPLKVVADHLQIREHTLRNHLTAIYGKLGVTNRLGLYDYAHRHALVHDAR
jgi:two-component system, NarL family, nitrate/nitrite response regulator NarL